MLDGSWKMVVQLMVGFAPVPHAMQAPIIVLEMIVPAILSQKRVLIAAHGNSLRALVKHLDKLSDDEVVNLNIPTGMPLLYELDDHLKPIRHEYLGDPEQVRQAIEAVAVDAVARHRDDAL